jgi:hypothetical protein
MKKLIKTTNARRSSLAAVSLLGFALAACSTQSAPKTVAAGAACGELAQGDKTLEQFYQPGSVARVEPIEKRVFKARAIQPVETVGASLYVRAEPGMTAPYLRRVLACHAGSEQSMHPNDPLHPQSGQVADLRVQQAKSGFLVQVSADSPAVGKEIWQRAKAMTHGSGNVQVQQLARGEGALQF